MIRHALCLVKACFLKVLRFCSPLIALLRPISSVFLDVMLVKALVFWGIASRIPIALFLYTKVVRVSKRSVSVVDYLSFVSIGPAGLIRFEQVVCLFGVAS